MKRQSIIAAALLLITTYTYAQLPSTPESFVTQIEKNVSRLDGWTKVYANELGYFKIRAYAPTAQSIDVIRSDSVLRPYLGKLHFLFSFARGNEFETRKLAEDSNTSGSLSTYECHMDFSPGKVAWEATRIRCRMTGIPQITEFNRTQILGSPLGDVIMALETAPSSAHQKKSPMKKAI